MIICGRPQKTFVIRETLPGSTQTATSLLRKRRRQSMEPLSAAAPIA